MNEHFLKYIQIKNFKCFTDFKAEGFQRVNLIGGKNNVGKTILMEACYVNVASKSIKEFTYNLIRIKTMREKINLLQDLSKSDNNSIRDNILKYIELLNDMETASNCNKTLYKIEENSGIKEYIFEFNQHHIKVNKNDFSFDTAPAGNIIFIDNFGFLNREIIKYYTSIQKNDKEYYLNTLIQEFDPNILAFKFFNDKPQCKVNDTYLELSEFGDGIKQLISIVVALYTTENGYLFIDEIDNGIHYTMLEKIWEIVLTLSKELNVQVFATTHSKECIEAYARVAKKLEDKEIAYIKMTRLNNGEIKAGVRNYELLQDSMEESHEVRGW